MFFILQSHQPGCGQCSKKNGEYLYNLFILLYSLFFSGLLMGGISISTKQTKCTKTLHSGPKGKLLCFSEKYTKKKIVETVGPINFPVR